MLFTLEALKAKHGDALILYCGTIKSPKLIVIDGGLGGVYNREDNSLSLIVDLGEPLESQANYPANSRGPACI